MFCIMIGQKTHRISCLEYIEDLDKLDKSKAYPIDIGARGIEAIDYICAYDIFGKYNNLFKGLKFADGRPFGTEEKVPGFTGTRIELMWALAEA